MKKQRNCIFFAALLYIAALVIQKNHDGLALVFFVCAYLVLGLHVLGKALKNIVRGQIFDENFLMSIATLGAFAIGEYPEAVAVMLFYQIGELFESYAVGKSRSSVAALMDIRPDYANLFRENEESVKVSPWDVCVGDVIVVNPGEKVPLDGYVLSGESTLDTSALSGESLPGNVGVGDEVLSGSINLSGVLHVKVQKPFEESTVSKILDLVENAAAKKSTKEKFITRFASVYTPIVVACAVLLAVVPPMIVGWASFTTWFYRALEFLVVSCPCALVISVPLSFFGGIGGASRVGVLVKGGNDLESLSRMRTVVFDKTGTLTKGVFAVVQINSVGIDDDELLRYAAYAESFSPHPIARSLKRAYKKNIDQTLVHDVQEQSGRGVSAVVEGKTVLCGNALFMMQHQIDYKSIDDIGSVVYVALDGCFAGSIVISDVLKDDSKTALQALKRAGVKKMVMLTGDNQKIADHVAEQLGLDGCYGELLPQDKVEKVEMLLKEKPANDVLAFVGDGINDAPVLSRADVGIAMGALGSDAAIEAADVVVMTDELSKIAQAMQIAKKTMRIANQNILFALGIKIGVLVLIALGLVNMWAAVFADVGVSVLAILNALRALAHPKAAV